MGAESFGLAGTKIQDMSSKNADYMNLMHDVIKDRDARLHAVPQHESIWKRFEGWITQTDFFTAPASTRFHGSFPGGLVEHHLDVYNETVDLVKLDKFKNVNADSAYLCALVHDFCKIGMYDPYMRNVKNEETGQWEKVQAYKYDKPQYPFGHGVTSMYLANQFFRLTREEALAIRWHMGEYNCCENEMSDLQEARDRYPLVLLLQTADRFSITAY